MLNYSKWFIVKFGTKLYNKKSTMKFRHHRNSSLLQETYRNNPLTHHRSYSYTRHTKNTSNLYSNFVSPDNFTSDHVTLPMSTEFNRDGKYRKKFTAKDIIQRQMKEKKNTKSKQKQSIERRKKIEKRQQRFKKSNQKDETVQYKGSKEIQKHKNINEKSKEPNSGEQKQRKTDQFKKDSVDISKINRPSQQEQKFKTREKKKGRTDNNLGKNWEDIIIEYSAYLTLEEISEIKEYKWIYFLGKIKDRKLKNGFKNSSNLNSNIMTQNNLQQKINLVQMLTEVKLGDQSQQNSRNYSSENEFYKYEIGDHIAYRYEIIESINQGSFGEVVKVYDHKSKQYLALKITKRCQDLVQQTFVQITILTHVKEKDKANLSGVVRIKDFTIFRNHICIVFQLLDGNLYQLLVVNNYNGLSEDVVRIFAVQILSSLSFLEKEKIIHCDIKPENIVMKTWGKSGVKLVDFGTSCFQGKQVYEYLQSRYYRAPQVIFKKKYSYPIDMWSFGCLIAELKIGQPIFAGSSNVEQLMYISNSIGFPNEQDGPYSIQFLKSNQFRQIFSQNYLLQYKNCISRNQQIQKHNFFSKCKYINTCMKTLEDRLNASKGFNKGDSSFYNFLLKILTWEPEKRLKPHQALQDPWITKGLPTQIKQLYTIVNSVQYSKNSKGKSIEVKSSSKNKKNSKKSNDKKRRKQHSDDTKKYNETYKAKDAIVQKNTNRYCNKITKQSNCT